MTYTYAGLITVFVGLSISKFLRMDDLGLTILYAGILLCIVGIVRQYKKSSP